MRKQHQVSVRAKFFLICLFSVGIISIIWRLCAVNPAAAQEFPTIVELADLDGTNGFVVNGIDSGDNSGQSVSNAGDVNGDGIDDIIIGAHNAAFSRGEGYVVFGSGAGFTASIELSALDGTNGFVINGIDPGDNLGGSNLHGGVSGAGDVNGDGIDDIIIGAPEADPGGRYSAGESYVVFGSTTGFTASLDLATLDGTNGTNGFVINGINYYDRTGMFVSGAGDVNGDGIDDVIIKGGRGAGGAGENYVVFGSTTGFTASLDLATLDGTNGFVINGIDPADQALFVNEAGDVNGDGIDDIIIGANLADPGGNGDAGESYVVFGSTTGFTASLDLAALDGTNGFVINGIDPGDQSGHSVSAAGDVNGDGIDDVIIGNPGGTPNGNSFAGESYVVFGKSSSVEGQIETIIEIVENMDIPPDVEEELTEVFDNAIKILNDDNPNNDDAVCHKLNAFINKVNSKEKDGELTMEQADELRTRAEAIRTTLNCV